MKPGNQQISYRCSVTNKKLNKIKMVTGATGPCPKNGVGQAEKWSGTGREEGVRDENAIRMPIDADAFSAGQAIATLRYRLASAALRNRSEGQS